MTGDITQQANQWHVSGQILIHNAHALLKQSMSLPMPREMTIDLSAVKDVDTSALSLIMEWQRRALAENSVLTFIHLPANLISLATLYGVTELIPTPSH